MADHLNTEPILTGVVDEICDDLEDLRDALIAALQSYEKDLKIAIGYIPVWTEIQEDDVYQLFEIPEIEDAILGPRSVAIVAQSIEEHVEKWLGFPGEIVAKRFTDEDTETYREDCAKVESELLSLSENARRVTSDATKKLGEHLDVIMHRLDEEREHDEDALKELVVDGSVKKGGSARAEIADLWERYRSHAESLNRVWEELESLAFQGMDMVTAGIDDIRWIMKQSDDALTLINPELSPDYEIIEPPVRDQDSATFELSRDGEEPPKKEKQPGERETVEIDRHYQDVLDKEAEGLGESEFSEISEFVADEFWGRRTISRPNPVPIFEVLVWALPLIGLVGLGITFGVNPEVIYGLNVPNLPVIVGGIAMMLFMMPIFRKWKFTPSPKREVRTEEDLRIEIGGIVKIANKTVDDSDSIMERWKDEGSAQFGWQLTLDEFTIVGSETNLTRWEDGKCEIVSRDTEGWRLSKSEFRTLCKALSIPLI